MEKEKLNAVYDFVNSETKILDFWKKNGILNKLRIKNQNGKKYRFIDGPITANGSMGVHHLWGRSLKDIFLRYKTLNGYDARYQYGYDGQGLWIEVVVEKELGFNSKKDIEAYGLDNFTNKCMERVDKSTLLMQSQSERLGMWQDAKNSYHTKSDDNILGIWYFLKKCHEKGMIKRVLKPRTWCMRCGTSLSEHEMSDSYREIEHDAVFIKLPLENGKKIVVWTTTPWTLAANVALAVNPGIDYCEFTLSDGDTLICSKKAFEDKFEKKENAKLLKTFKGKQLTGLKYEAVFEDLECQKFDHKIVPWEEVSETDGSGVVHIAPGCGEEDAQLGLKQNLPVICPVDEAGNYFEDFGFLKFKNAKECNNLVFDRLKSSGKMIYVHKIKHSYPVCWRCKTETIVRSVSDWVIDVDIIRKDLVKNAKKTVWTPAHEEKRMVDWLENMGDWSISRKRFYGLPLPIFVCPACDKLHVVGSLEELSSLAVDKSLIRKMPHIHRPWIDDIKIKCACGGEVSRIPEVGDVWLDAGIVAFTTLKYFTDREYWKKFFPAEYVTEMKEQVRLWFYSLLFMSTVMVNQTPYERVVTHGMITDENGKKFSKTNYMINVDEIFGKIGADATRYIFAGTPNPSDVRFGFKVAEDAKRRLLSFWNICVFFDTYAKIDKPKISLKNLKEKLKSDSDKWLYAKVNEFVKIANDNYKDYSTKDIVTEFDKICEQISNYYVRVNRRIFWKEQNDAEKLSAYTVLFYAIKNLAIAISPIIPFMTEYIWQNLISSYEKAGESINFAKFPKGAALSDEDKKLVEKIDNARSIISLGLKIRNEKAIKVKQPLKTLFIAYYEGLTDCLNSLGDIIKRELNIKEIKIAEEKDLQEKKYLTLNFKKAGAFFKQKVNEVKDKLQSLTDKIMDKLVNDHSSGKTLEIEGFGSEIPNDMFIVNTKGSSDLAIASGENNIIALDLTIDENLMKEGVLREILRQCQVLRKESGFDISDRISVAFSSENKQITDILKEYKSAVSGELLAENVFIGQKKDLYYKVELELDEGKLFIQMEKV